MENPSPQPQYFRFSNEPTEAPKPWFRRPEVVKRILGIGGVVVAILFLAIFVTNLVKSISDSPKNAKEAAEQEMAQRQIECEESDEACKMRVQKEIARTSGVASVCDGLEEKKKESCVTLAAREKKNTATCSALSGDAATRCKDSVLIARVADGEGMEVCQETSEEKRMQCENIVTSQARALGTCTELGVAEEVCAEKKTIEALVSAGNFAGCAELAEEQRGECVDMFTSIDADGDGLNAKKEAELGTSDSNSDTDGDGYSDAVEVQSGYNPLQ